MYMSATVFVTLDAILECWIASITVHFMTVGSPVHSLLILLPTPAAEVLAPQGALLEKLAKNLYIELVHIILYLVGNIHLPSLQVY
jgi:hypothetical protein